MRRRISKLLVRGSAGGGLRHHRRRGRRGALGQGPRGARQGAARRLRPCARSSSAAAPTSCACAAGSSASALYAMGQPAITADDVRQAVPAGSRRAGRLRHRQRDRARRRQRGAQAAGGGARRRCRAGLRAGTAAVRGRADAGPAAARRCRRGVPHRPRAEVVRGAISRCCWSGWWSNCAATAGRAGWPADGRPAALEGGRAAVRRRGRLQPALGHLNGGPYLAARSRCDARRDL